jgi:hypothetical protein
MLVFSIYISPLTYHQLSEDMIIQFTLEEIQTSIREATVNLSKSTIFILAGDFNRHHSETPRVLCYCALLLLHISFQLYRRKAFHMQH